MIDTKAILEAAQKMPVLSQSAMRLMEVMGDENHSFQEIGEIIATDPVMTLEALKIVNSAAYSLRQPVTSVVEAIPYLGEKMIIGIAMNIGAPRVFNRPLFGYEGAKGALWAHSLRTAIGAAELSFLAKEDVSPGLAFTAGILHDIGKSVLSSFLSGLTGKMIQDIDNGAAKDYIEAEESITGTNHCKIGGELAKHWRLPEVFSTVIINHHLPEEAPERYKTLLYIVHLADMISMMGGTGTGVDCLGYQLNPKYIDHIKIDHKTLENSMMKVAIEFDKICELLFGEKKDD